jgi:Ca-activated chloride channel family protein
MKITMQNIDQQFNEAIGKLEGNPQGVSRDPEANWATIEQELDRDRRKKRAAVWWIAAAASIAVLVLVGWGLMPNRTGDLRNDLAYDQEPLLDNPKPSREELEQFKAKKERLAMEKQDVQNEERMEDFTKANEKAIVTGTGSLKSDRKVVRGGNWANVSNFTTTNGSTVPINQGSTITLHSNGGTPVYNWTPSSNNAATISPNPPTVTFYDVTTQQKDPYAYTWTFGDGKAVNGQTHTYNQAGKYTVSGVDANGCISTGKATVIGKKDKAKPNLGFFATADTIMVSNIEPYGSESYAETVENAYYLATQEPLSTFSIDVDRASYTNHRRFIEASNLPPKYAVRAEEFINYFDYNYAQPRTDVPFSILPEMTTCPWNPKHKLVRIALKGKEVATENVPASNLVFLIDVSGSMTDADKLPLLKKAMALLTEQLREQDKVSIVVYAGAAGLVLPPTSGSNKRAILAALDQLEAGGSTAGGEGIELAYATAKKNYMTGGNNRVILATDGDFNVGISDETGLEKLIVKKREEGVFLSVLGFGEGNLQDSKMELLADKGNGNYNYIDGEKEAQKVLVSEFGGTLYTIAKDVKIQVEFNPAQVEAYRLVGYENRKLKNEDFANDKIDAGELGAGHTVTALYEIVPAKEGWTGARKEEDLKYQTRTPSDAASTKEVLTVKLRYKEPDGQVSKLLEKVLMDDGRNIAQTSEDFRWAVAVAEYALILRESDYKGMASYDQVLALARSAVGQDKEGLRTEFIELVTKASGLTQTAKGN